MAFLDKLKSLFDTGPKDDYDEEFLVPLHESAFGITPVEPIIEEKQTRGGSQDTGDVYA